MADIVTKRIDELTAAESVNGSDLFVIEQSGEAKKVAASLFIGSDIIFVTYGISTFEEIETAYNDGKMVYVQDGNYAYPLTMFDGENAEFSGYTTEGNVTITCADTDEWDKYTVSYMNAVDLAQRGQVLYYNGLNWSAHTPTKSDVGLGNVDNTSDLAKPVSTATQTALDGKENTPTEYNISTAGAVSQQLSAGDVYHFTGALTSLTITFAQAQDLPHYHFDFLSGSTAPTLTLPSAVVMPDSFSVEANKRYEVDILNNYGAVMAWAIS